MPKPRPFVSQEGLHVDVYEELLAAEAASPVEGDVDFFIDMARQTGGPVLEIGCGTFFRSPPAYGKEQVWVVAPHPAQ